MITGRRGEREVIIRESMVSDQRPENIDHLWQDVTMILVTMPQSRELRICDT